MKPSHCKFEAKLMIWLFAALARMDSALFGISLVSRDATRPNAIFVDDIEFYSAAHGYTYLGGSCRNSKLVASQDVFTLCEESVLPRHQARTPSTAPVNSGVWMHRGEL